MIYRGTSRLADGTQTRLKGEGEAIPWGLRLSYCRMRGESHHEARRFLNLRGSANFPWWTVRMNRRPSQKINKFCYLDALEVSDWMERCMEGGATFLTSVFASLCNVRNIFILRELHYYRCLLSQPSTNVDWRKVQDDGGTRKGRFCSCYGWRWSLVVVSRCVAVIDWCHFWKKIHTDRFLWRTGFCIQ